MKSCKPIKSLQIYFMLGFYLLLIISSAADDNGYNEPSSIAPLDNSCEKCIALDLDGESSNASIGELQQIISPNADLPDNWTDSDEVQISAVGSKPIIQMLRGPSQGYALTPIKYYAKAINPGGGPMNLVFNSLIQISGFIALGLAN